MISTFELTRKTTSDTDILDLTDDVAARVEQTGVRQGQVLIFTPGSTAAITTIEYEAGVVQDLKQAIERLALGTWQQIVLLDFDNHGRTRRVVVQVSGETS